LSNDKRNVKRPGWIALLLVVVALGAVAYFLVRPRPVPSSLDIDFTKDDGTLGSWIVSMRPPQPGESAAQYLRDRVFYATVAEISGPPSNVKAVRFPPGTHALGVIVSGSQATVDLSKDVTADSPSTFEENGEFKALVFTLTGISGINSVQVLVEGKRLATLPGGSLEIDTPLTRSDFE
jgi:hypothetical protein